MELKNTALILIGYQNDYFSKTGVLSNFIENSSNINKILNNTILIIKQLIPSSITIISTPIQFTKDYEELTEPYGILKTIKENNAFQAGTKGSETVKELHHYKDRIIEVPGKRGLNAFHKTDLNVILQNHRIKNIVLAGVVTSICIDSTARYAFDNGYKVFILSDCTYGITEFEQDYYVKNIFPLYAEVFNHNQFLKAVSYKD